MRSFILLFLILIFTTTQSHARRKVPSMQEYNNVPKGLMMPQIELAKKREEDAYKALPLGELKKFPKRKKEKFTFGPELDKAIAAYYKGEYDNSFDIILDAAKKNHPQSQEIIGIMYKMGQGVNKDPKASIEWLKKAAEAERPLAQHHLGVSFFTGQDIEKNPIKALMWLRIAAVSYQTKEERKRAKTDRDNIAAQLTKEERANAAELSSFWLEKKGKGHLISAP